MVCIIITQFHPTDCCDTVFDCVGKFCCLVCRRQFPTEDKLVVHIEKSQLHCENLARLRKEGRISATATPSAGVSTVTPASGVNAFAIDGLLGTASKLEEQLRNLKQQKEAAAEKKASPTTGAATTTGSSSLDALFAFENKMRSSSGGGGGATTGYRDRAKERRELTGVDEALPASSIKRAREINNNIDWKCYHCNNINFARVIMCTKCGKEVDDKTEYLNNHMQEKRHKAIMKMANSSSLGNGLGGKDQSAIAQGLSGLGFSRPSDRPGLGSGR